MKKIVIAIDGYSSCGKSTLAKEMSKELGYIFIDSGAMYRAITLYFLENKVDTAIEMEVVEALKNITIHFELDAAIGKSLTFLNNKNVETTIREMFVSENVSTVSAIKEVREHAVAQQQLMGISKGIIMDGRDIGTTVFPNAELKIFVTADTDVRVERRYLELVAKDPAITKEEIKQNLAHRDHIDTTREISPLRKAEDAILLDNTNLTREEQLTIALNWAKEKINNA